MVVVVVMVIASLDGGARSKGTSWGECLLCAMYVLMAGRLDVCPRRGSEIKRAACGVHALLSICVICRLMPALMAALVMQLVRLSLQLQCV